MGCGCCVRRETAHRDDDDAGEKEMSKKPRSISILLCTMVMCSPPVSTSKSCVSISLKRGSRASMARKNPSLVARAKRSQLKMGLMPARQPVHDQVREKSGESRESTVSSNMTGKNAGTVASLNGFPCTITG